MDFYTFTQILAVAGPMLLSIGSAVYAYIASRRKDADKVVKDLTERIDSMELQLTAAATNSQTLMNIDRILDDHEKRMLSIEGEFRHLPGKDDVHQLQLAMTKLEGTVGTLAEKMGGVDRTVRRIDDFMRTEGKGGT